MDLVRFKEGPFVLGADAQQVKQILREAESIPVVDFSDALSVPVRSELAKRHVLVVETQQGRAGIAVSGEIQILNLAKESIVPIPPLVCSKKGGLILVGIGFHQDEIVLLVDLEAVAREKVTKVG